MIKQIKKYKFLIEELIKRDFKTKYKRSILGVAWSLLNPLLSLLIMRLVFSKFFGSTIEHYTTFLFCGNIIFSFFSEATSESLVALLANAPIFSKVNIPKYFFVVSKNLQISINFLATLLVFFVFCIFDNITFSAKFIFLIYPVIMLIIFTLGIGFFLSAMYVFFRDIKYLWSVVLQMLMYVSAIFYSTDVFPQNIRALFYLNPIYVYITYFRQIVLDSAIPSVAVHILALAYAIIAFLIGFVVYRKFDDEFMYYI